MKLQLSAQANGEPDISVHKAFEDAGWDPTMPEDKFIEWFEFDFEVGEQPEVSSLWEYTVNWFDFK